MLKSVIALEIRSDCNHVCQCHKHRHAFNLKCLYYIISFKELNIKAHKKCTTDHKDQSENSKSKREKQQKTTSLILEIAQCCKKIIVR